jgi:hypothetical protein
MALFKSSFSRGGMFSKPFSARFVMNVSSRSNSSQDLESFLLDLDQALTWLGTLGIQPNQTRFSRYREILGTVLEHRMAGTVDELRTIVPQEQYRIAFIESTDLIAIAKNFGRIRSSRFREKLRVAITGPVHPLDEERSGMKPRDLLFELAVAAFFRSRKFPVLTYTDKDLITRVSGHTLLVECKRPQSENKVLRSIKKATRQLMKHFKNYNRGDMLRGLIVLDISIVMNPQRMYLNADSDEAIDAELRALLDDFQTEFKSALGYGRDKRILGILFFAKVLGYNGTANQHINCQARNICFHVQPYDRALAEDLYRRLRPRDEASPNPR